MNRSMVALAATLGLGISIGVADKGHAQVPRASTPEGRAATNPALREELLARADTDQMVRKAAAGQMKNGTAVVTGAGALRAGPIDAENTARMREILDKNGWPGSDMVGTDGAFAAFLLIQHADADPSLQERALPLMQAAFDKGLAKGQYLAYLVDRVRIAQKKPQVYRTQMGVINGVFGLQAVEDSVHLDDRRKAVGLEPIADYLKRFVVKPPQL